MFSEKQGNVLHGILLIVLFSFSAFYIAEFQFIKNLSLSPLIVGIILGMLYANSLRNRLPETWVPGIKFCSKQVLRAGIVLYGFRLTFQSVIAIGASAILIDVIIVTCTILLGILVGKLLKMDNDLALLTATGSAICGAAAVLGAEPVVKSEPHKTAVAVSTVVIFGTLSMFIYPILYRAGVFDLTPEQMGLYTGSTLHEVAHVVGAERNGERDFRLGNHRKNDSSHAPCSGFTHHEFCLSPPSRTSSQRRQKYNRHSTRKNHHSLVRIRFPCRYRIQFIRLASRSSSRRNQ